MSTESAEANAGKGNYLWDRITGPQPAVSIPLLPQTPPPLSPSLPGVYENDDIASVVDRAIQRLNEAAKRIAEVEQGSRRMPRASRLSPLRDISADIQRQSTPLPKLVKGPEADASSVGAMVCPRPQEEQGKDLAKHMPDLWPWLQEDADPDENDFDQWSTDPLMSRQFPNSAETKRIEEEDLRRAIAEGMVTLPIPPQRVSSTRRRIHTAFSVFVVLAIAFLVADGVLLAFIFTHPHRHVPLLNGPPQLTLSANAASIGETLILHIRHFSGDTHVYLTHDIQEPVQVMTAGQREPAFPLVKVAANGSADVTMLVDSTWGPGYHTIEAEGITTRYTASATLQIVGAGPTRPAHLLIGTT